MTVADLVALRQALGFTQAEMGEAIGMSKRAIQEIEGGTTPLRRIHVAAAERVALAEAVARQNPMLAPVGVRRDALAMARHIAG